MFCRIKIDLSEGASFPQSTLISREVIGRYTHASDVLEQANIQALQLLQSAAEQREDLLEKASLEIWQRANAQLKRWENDRLVMCNQIEHYASSIANQAIRLLLDDTPVSLRLAALVKQLLASEVPTVEATLLCNPLDFETTKQCLMTYGNTLWVLRPDDTVKPQTLVLNTEEGDFRIDWASMLDLFLKHNNAYVMDLETHGETFK